MELEYTVYFRHAYDRLTKEEARCVDKAIVLLGGNPRHPGLRVKKIQGAEGIWEARASRSLRITFELRGDVIILRNVGDHDVTLKRP